MKISEITMWAKRLKDKKFRLNFSAGELNNLPFVFFQNNSNLDNVLRMFVLRKFVKKNKKNYLTQVKNRCVISLRSRSLIKSFRVSRVFFRSAASSGLLLGVKKSSW